jgi:hypothetical protein
MEVRDNALVRDLYEKCAKELEKLDEIGTSLHTRANATEYLKSCKVLYDMRARVLEIMERLAVGSEPHTSPTAWDRIKDGP